MDFIKTKLAGSFLIEPKTFEDQRGFFLESYSKKIFEENGINDDFIQDNHSLSVEKGVLRGLHFQLSPNAQSKLVRVVAGSVFDVIVDLRKDSKTFGQWQGFELSAKNKKMLYVPRGFAHAFCTLEENTEFVYKVDNFYAPESDSGIIWNDRTLAIDWPIEGEPVISEKDGKLQTFEEFKALMK
ncbi:dTDP-4-dehydrorhamnose 3,5-epimerase [bacterium]|jgi:dTDP-4-dehydrorhamnose 3,5-epimerase|nr:dTDP-4-dehydrorhamnose 3,5-epimerase [bacterium]MBT4250840.1 dTDP-4-dehydrorhamnose 3,5-epimerase [bacterium]MBT4597552.1 dTDP-4-dehydrorhamnose 3,5-epimerase [bacterium]MBT6754018.1 dTDP-4-dehydrorhamnose 3,5-epimerase [bacterium]MBT7038048.1 dTDP-4-dehydrorhamnose 3,5-epimerase [bacterium]